MDPMLEANYLLTQPEIAGLFEEWKRRYDEDPDAYQSHEAFVSDAPQSYGQGSARYFLFLLDELTANQVK